MFETVVWCKASVGPRRFCVLHVTAVGRNFQVFRHVTPFGATAAVSMDNVGRPPDEVRPGRVGERSFLARAFAWDEQMFVKDRLFVLPNSAKVDASVRPRYGAEGREKFSDRFHVSIGRNVGVKAVRGVVIRVATGDFRQVVVAAVPPRVPLNDGQDVGRRAVSFNARRGECKAVVNAWGVFSSCDQFCPSSRLCVRVSLAPSLVRRVRAFPGAGRVLVQL